MCRSHTGYTKICHFNDTFLRKCCSNGRFSNGTFYRRPLGWVDLGFECSTVCSTLPGLMWIWQRHLCNWARWSNIQIKVNQTLVHEQMGHPVCVWLLIDVIFLNIVKFSQVLTDFSQSESTIQLILSNLTECDFPGGRWCWSPASSPSLRRLLRAPTSKKRQLRKFTFMMKVLWLVTLDDLNIKISYLKL